MKVTRIRKHKRTTEITFVVNAEEAQNLAHFLSCENCIYPDRQAKGAKLAKQLYNKGVTHAW
jgi:hypothetical protein